VSDALTVHVNDGQLHSLDLPDRFETSESFDVRLLNHGESTHVHLHLDDSLSEIAFIDAPNHHVNRDSERRVRVTLTEEGTARGNLKVVTAYGATTRYVDLEITEPDPTDEPVEVSEDLAKPQPRETDRDIGFDPPLRPVLAVGGGAILLAVATAVLVQQLFVVAVAALVALVALAAIGAAWAT
jgi:hypothetical protein